MALVGTRPEAIKVAPVVSYARRAGEEVCLISTGQHQAHMLEAFQHFGIEIDVELGLFRSGQTLTSITIDALSAVSREIELFQPDVVLVQGDTTTAFAGALAAFYQKVPVAHLEAGLRSHNMQNPFPEEMNRKLIDGMASFIFPPTAYAEEQLEKEGIRGEHVFRTGNTVVDSLYALLEASRVSRDGPVADEFFTSIDGRDHRGHVLITAHRRESWGEPMDRLAAAIRAAAVDHPEHLFYAPLHPNPIVRASFKDMPDNVLVGEPLPYPVFLRAMDAADVIITDSGGATEEGTSLGKRVIVVREETERPEAIAAGCAVLVGLDQARIEGAIRDALSRPRDEHMTQVFGDGLASQRCVDWLRWRFGRLADKPAPFVPGQLDRAAERAARAAASAAHAADEARAAVKRKRTPTPSDQENSYA